MLNNNVVTKYNQGDIIRYYGDIPSEEYELMLITNVGVNLVRNWFRDAPMYEMLNLVTVETYYCLTFPVDNNSELEPSALPRQQEEEGGTSSSSSG